MNVPILGQNQPPPPDRFDREYGGVHSREETTRGDLHDSEILAIEEVYKKLGQRNGGQRRDLAAFEREIKDRFHAIGFAVDVAWYEFSVDGHKQDGAYLPEISIIGRVEKTTFDHDQKVHEVTSNLLGLDEPTGIIRTDGGAA